ncbi:hypothetical protein F444_12771 [Phytophthora nicotianae P1976]|uniref:Uncharacterized protein n=1 Tax=Phytophthora nicotianae P1976 TaxID=1317066 RepID=A0A080ZVY0_PHYNI|nr:hypothetical protein F444_12771 [Phytophthora nicotianae P1976]
MIEKLGPMEAYQGDVHALQKLLQLHILCNILSNVSFLIQFGIPERRDSFCNYTHSSARRIYALSSLLCCRKDVLFHALKPFRDNEDDQDIDPPNANHIEWQEDQERHLDIVDYDAMDLIELSEQFS